MGGMHTMKRNNKLLLGFGIIVLVPVVTIWVTVWPILRAWTLPSAVSGYENRPHTRVLSDEEVLRFNQWLQSHQTGWGIAGEKPSGEAQRIVTLTTEKNTKIIISFWHFRHGDDVAGIQMTAQGDYRMRSFPSGALVSFIKE